MGVKSGLCQDHGMGGVAGEDVIGAGGEGAHGEYVVDGCGAGDAQVEGWWGCRGG